MGSRLTKEEIQAALNERHSPEVQDMLSSRTSGHCRSWRSGFECSICA